MFERVGGWTGGRVARVGGVHVLGERVGRVAVDAVLTAVPPPCMESQKKLRLEMVPMMMASFFFFLTRSRQSPRCTGGLAC